MRPVYSIKQIGLNRGGAAVLEGFGALVHAWDHCNSSCAVIGSLPSRDSSAHHSGRTHEGDVTTPGHRGDPYLNQSDSAIRGATDFGPFHHNGVQSVHVDQLSSGLWKRL